MNAMKGTVTAILSSALIALFYTYTFRFPVPLGGLLGPFGDISPYSIPFTDVLSSVAMAWIFYGALGGYVVLAVMGAIAGSMAGRRYGGTDRKNRMIVLWASLAAALPVTALSVLDYIIGPW